MGSWPKKSTIALTLWLLCGMFSVSGMQAQTYAVVAKGGYIDYEGGRGGSVGGGGYTKNWERGPILGLGLRWRTSESFAIEGILDYSWHRYALKGWESELVNDPWNRVAELNAIARYSIAVYRPVYFDLLAGVGMSYQAMDDQVFAYPEHPYTAYGTTVFHLSGVLGFALEGRIADRVELSLEGTWHMRFYISPAVQLGIAYVIVPG